MGQAPFPHEVEPGEGGSGRNKTFSSLSYHHPSLFRDSHCSAEIRVLQSGGVELAGSCFPEHRPQLLAGMDLPGGARAAPRPRPRSCAGVRALPARHCPQQGSEELPALHLLLSCRNSIPVFLLRALCDLWGRLPAPPLIQMVSEKTLGRAERVSVFGLSLCRGYDHGRHFLTLTRKFQYEFGFVSPQLPGKKAESEVPILSTLSSLQCNTAMLSL